MKVLINFFIFLSALSKIFALNSEISCEFSIQTNFETLKSLEYTCNVKKALPDDRKIIITSSTGNHSLNKANTDVTAISFFNNDLFFIPKGLKVIFKSLAALKIDSTPLRHVSKITLDEFPDLKALQITNSNLQYIGKNLFIELTKIELIDLRKNQIFFIDSEVFKNELNRALSNLKILQLSENTCDVLDAQLDGVDRQNVETVVSELDNSGCSNDENVHERFIESILSPSSDVSDLKRQITTLNSTLEKLVENLSSCEKESEKFEIEILSLKSELSSAINESNQWQDLAEKCTTNSTCMFMENSDGYACSAKIVIKSSFDQKITWTGNHLSSNSNSDVKVFLVKSQSTALLPLEVGKTFKNIQTFIVESSKLQNIKKNDFQTLENLKKMILTKNEISSIESGTFDVLTKLTNLNLKDNKISAFPSKAFEKLISLQFLDVSENKILQLKSDLISSGNKIANFYAKNNNLSKIDIIFIWRLNKAKIIDFSGNGCNYCFDRDVNKSFTKDFFNVILTNC